MKLSLEEKDSLELISSIALLDRKEVENVFISLLKTIVIKLFREETNVYIPYIGNLNIDYFDKIIEGKGVTVEVVLQIEPSVMLKKQILEFSEDGIMPTQEYIKLKIAQNIIDRVDK